MDLEEAGVKSRKKYEQFPFYKILKELLNLFLIWEKNNKELDYAIPSAQLPQIILQMDH